MTQRTKIAAAAVTSVLLLGAIDKRIDSDRVYQQARVAEAANAATEASTPVVPVENMVPFARSVVGTKWFPMAGFAWFSIASGVQEEWIHD